MYNRLVIFQGEHNGYSLPASRKSKDQNRDALELSHSLLFDDNALISFIIKALVFFQTIAQAISRFATLSRLIDEALRSSMEKDPSEGIAFPARKLRGFKTEELRVFRTNLSLHHLYDQEASTHRFGLQFRQALADIPTQAEALHGATCSKYFCTYVI